MLLDYCDYLVKDFISKIELEKTWMKGKIVV